MNERIDDIATQMAAIGARAREAAAVLAHSPGAVREAALARGRRGHPRPRRRPSPRRMPPTWPPPAIAGSRAPCSTALS